MRSNQTAPIAFLVVFVLLAGCVPAGNGITISFNGNMNTSESGFNMDGVLVAQGGIPDQDTYSNVSVVLYSNNSTIIKEKPIGDLASEGRINVSINASESPQYIVFNSPEFWQGNNQVEYYVRNNGRYGIKYAETESELPGNHSR